ncbi:metallophosphoesterase [Tumebacillus sp. ITR2]|uniref:Metallophosphoesterase n=1 Tax=Tumebacillus amylolyticus TaxID=2801339 RepID=A0ABS1JCH1_9BACL|nr:metallophosphoesterase [Tumebacillus amylolyticus]MBL0387724.1 metallophosphoesterase [Tumebacillus amylolyticus]
MNIFAIGDLHLSFANPKPMDIFGDNWADHPDKIRSHWESMVTADDLVLIPGDISWAMSIEEAKPDLDYIASLPGRKLMIRGNHDYWWSTVTKVRKALHPSIQVLQNDSITIGDITFAATRGWDCPGSYSFDEHDRTVYEREVGRLKLSLDHAMKTGAKRIWVMLHYPPTNEKHQETGFLDVIRQYPVEKVVYGHLHGSDGHKGAFEGVHDGIEYRLVACDYLDFAPLKLT